MVGITYNRSTNFYLSYVYIRKNRRRLSYGIFFLFFFQLLLILVNLLSAIREDHLFATLNPLNQSSTIILSKFEIKKSACCRHWGANTCFLERCQREPANHYRGSGANVHPLNFLHPARVHKHITHKAKANLLALL